MKRTIVITIPIIAILLVGLVGNKLILSGAKNVSLHSGGNNIAQAVEQSLQNSAGGLYAPIEGKDYSIGRIKYLDNGQWAVVPITPLNNFSDPALVVLQKNNGDYQVKLGPTNSFLGNNLDSLPADVANYLKGLGQ